RRAIQVGLNQEEIMLAAAGDKALYRLDSSLFFKEQFWHSNVGANRYNEHDSAKAKALVKEGGYDGSPIRIITSSDFQFMYNAALATESQLRQLGFATKLQAYDYPTTIEIFRKKRAEWDISYNAFSIRTDPGGFTFVLKSDSGYQPYASKEVDALLEKGLLERDRKARAKIYEQIQDQLYKDIPMIKHGDLFGFDALRERVDGFAVFYTTPRFWNVWVKDKRCRHGPRARRAGGLARLRAVAGDHHRLRAHPARSRRSVCGDAGIGRDAGRGGRIPRPVRARSSHRRPVSRLARPRGPRRPGQFHLSGAARDHGHSRATAREPHPDPDRLRDCHRARDPPRLRRCVLARYLGRSRGLRGGRPRTVLAVVLARHLPHLSPGRPLAPPALGRFRRALARPARGLAAPAPARLRPGLSTIGAHRPHDSRVDARRAPWRFRENGALEGCGRALRGRQARLPQRRHPRAHRVGYRARRSLRRRGGDRDGLHPARGGSASRQRGGAARLSRGPGHAASGRRLVRGGQHRGRPPLHAQRPPRAAADVVSCGSADGAAMARPGAGRGPRAGRPRPSRGLHRGRTVGLPSFAHAGVGELTAPAAVVGTSARDRSARARGARSRDG